MRSLAAILTISVLAGVVGCSSSAPGSAQSLPVTAEVELGGRTIELEVARTPQEQATGLMFRNYLDDDRGMLFPVDPPQPVSLWMKNVVIPLDMLFLADGKIVGIEANVPPCPEDPCPTYGPEGIPIDAVIEVRGGLANEIGASVGDAANIQASTEP